MSEKVKEAEQLGTYSTTMPCACPCGGECKLIVTASATSDPVTTAVHVGQPCPAFLDSGKDKELFAAYVRGLRRKQ